MTKSSATQHYTPFSCLKLLKTKNLLISKKQGRFDIISLTNEGWILAEKLLNSHERLDIPEPVVERREMTKIKQCESKLSNDGQDIVKKRKICEDGESIPLKQDDTSKDRNVLFNGYVYLTEDFTETKYRFEAFSETDDELCLNMLWIKSTESYLISKTDILYKFQSEKTNLFPKPYIFAMLHDLNADLVAPGIIKAVNQQDIHNDTEISIIETYADQRPSTSSKSQAEFHDSISGINSFFSLGNMYISWI